MGGVQIDENARVIDINQKPIGRTPRSNPGTYIKVFDQIRDLYAKLPDEIRVHRGGPVESGRGFVLHSADFMLNDASLAVGRNIALTSTLEILRAIATGGGPREAIFALGYAGWAPGQLESELGANGWLTVPADEAILFGRHNETKWRHAMAKLGVDVSLLSSTAGRA